MQRTTLAATYLGLALAAGTLRASTADHGALAAAYAAPTPPSSSPNTKPEGMNDDDALALAQIADDLTLLAQGDWDAEEEAMLAEMMLAETLAEYE